VTSYTVEVAAQPEHGANPASDCRCRGRVDAARYKSGSE
jgi:hypothetical protein